MLIPVLVTKLFIPPPRLRDTAEAFRYLEQGHARGKVVITVGESDTQS